MNFNPYESPSAERLDLPIVNQINGDRLASRLTRLGASIVDGLLLLPIFLPIQYLSGYTSRVMADQVGLVEQILMSLLGMISYLILNGYLLATRGQSIGKLLTNIQIVDAKSGRLLPMTRVYVYRYLWLLPLTLLVIFIPGQIDDQIVNLTSLINVLMIFGATRQCLHDHFAGSKVVEYQPNHQRMSQQNLRTSTSLTP